MVKVFVKLSNSVCTAAAGKLLKPFTDIPGPKSYPIIGTLYNYIPPFGEYRVDRLHWTGKLKYKKYGKLVREEILPGTSFLFIFDPVDIEAMFRAEGKYPSRRSHMALNKFRLDTPQDHNSGGLLPTNGEEWKNFRTSFQQALSRENIQSFIPATDQIISEFVNQINDPSMVSSNQDFLPHLLSLNMELVAEQFFGVRLNSFTESGKDSLAQRLIEASNTVNSLVYNSDTGLQLWKWIDTPIYRKIKKNMSLLENTAKFFISQRMKNEGGDATHCALQTWLKEGKADIKDIMTMSADMILAGIDTTAFTSSFAMYFLSTHQECQEKLFQELKNLLPRKDSSITFETLSEATYLKLVVKETLRLNPISVGTGRVIPEDAEIGGYHIPANTVAVSMNQVACRFPEYFENPDEFIPERWTVENRRMAKTHPFLLLPFGFGPRGCIGRRMAEQEIQMFIARLCRGFKLEWNGSAQLDCVSSNINRPDAPLLFTFTPRDS